MPPSHAQADPPSAPVRKLGSVLHNSTLYLIGNVASRIVGFLTIPFYSRYLSPAQYGLVELVELSTQTVAIALGLQAIGAALSRLFHDEKTPAGEREVVSTTLLSTVMISGVVTVGAVACSGFLSEAVFHTRAWTSLLQAAFLALFFSNFIEVVLVYERLRDNARFFVTYALGSLALMLLLNIVFIAGFGAGVWGFIISKLVVAIGGCVALGLRMRRDVGWRWRPALLPSLTQLAAPLAVSGLAYFLVHFSDRFFLTSAVSLADIGRYALAYRFAMLISVLVGDSFAKSWGVSLYRYTAGPHWRRQFADIAAYFSFALYATAMGLVLFAPELLRVMVPEDYMPPPLLLPLLVGAYLLREIGEFHQALLLINKRSMLIGKIAVGGALLNVAANYLLVDAVPLGVYGAALATFVTWFAYCVVCWVVSEREHGLPIGRRSFLMLTGFSVAIYSAAAATRVQAFLPQVMMDVAWMLLFLAVAWRVFLSPAQHRGIACAAASAGLWLVGRLAPSTPIAPARPGRHVLMLASQSPRESEVGAGRTQRFAKYLRRDGVTVSLVDADGDALSPGVVRVQGRGRARRLTRAAAAMLQRLLLPHDAGLTWVPNACRAAAETTRQGTVLFSTSPPPALHIAAMVTKHRYGAAWLADLREPLWGNPKRSSRRAAVLDPLIEGVIFEHADAVVVGTDAAAGLMCQRYPEHAGKIHVIWDGFDPEDGLSSCVRRPQPRRVLVHVGTLDRNRTLRPILRSLERLTRAGLLDPATIQLRQIGRTDPRGFDINDPTLEAMAARECFHLVGHIVPADEMQQEMLDAEWLLLLDPSSIHATSEVPVETFDCVRTGRPILALTKPRSSTQQVLELSGAEHVCVDPNASPEVLDATLLAFFERPARSSMTSAVFCKEFSAPYQAEQLQRIIDSVVGGRPPVAAVHEAAAE